MTLLQRLEKYVERKSDEYGKEVRKHLFEHLPDNFLTRAHKPFDGKPDIVSKSAYAAGANDMAGIVVRLVAGIEQELEDNDGDCGCGYEEPCGEGYKGGACSLHEALQSLEEMLVRGE